MKVYQFKHHEIFVKESAFNEERYIEQYNDLFEELLRSKNISNRKIYQVINLCNFTISDKPFLVEILLKKHRFPAFKFLTCNN